MIENSTIVWRTSKWELPIWNCPVPYPVYDNDQWLLKDWESRWKYVDDTTLSETVVVNEQ